MPDFFRNLNQRIAWMANFLIMTDSVMLSVYLLFASSMLFSHITSPIYCRARKSFTKIVRKNLVVCCASLGGLRSTGAGGRRGNDRRATSRWQLSASRALLNVGIQNAHCRRTMYIDVFSQSAVREITYSASEDSGGQLHG